MSKIPRRQMLKAIVITAAGAGLAKLTSLLTARRENQVLGQFLQPTPDSKETFLPFVSKKTTPTATATATATDTPTATATATNTPTVTSTVPPTGSRVVHVYSSSATSWDFGTSYYGDFVDQGVVNNMVDRGVRELTGAPSVAQAWQTLVPNYAPGKGIAIKVNFNNCWWCDKCRVDCQDWELAIDALIQPINSIVRGLRQAYSNLNNGDVWIYDATLADSSSRMIPQRFKDGGLYSGVRYFDSGCNEAAAYDSNDPSADVAWRNPADIATPPACRVTDVLIDAEYVINLPIMKKHVGKGVTLAFKNHFGSIAYCSRLHDWTGNGSPHYGGTRYNPLVDIYRNAHVGPKTVLTIGDALFGNWDSNISKPEPWTTFGNGAPNSLLFATDAVAIDSVMCDLIDAETWMLDMSRDYLVYAASVGLGVFEIGDPWGSGYNDIDYLKIVL